VAIARNRLIQPVVVALDRRFAALFLGAVFPLRRVTAAVCPLPAEIHRHPILDHRRGAVRAGQGLRIFRLCDFFGGILVERTHAEASCGRRRMLCDLAMLPDPSAADATTTGYLDFGSPAWSSSPESRSSMDSTSARCACMYS
jgi:hypothetical protein